MTVDELAGQVKQALADAPADNLGQALAQLERIAVGIEQIAERLGPLAKLLDPPVELVDCERCGGDGKLAGTVPCGACNGAGTVPKKKPVT